MNVIDLFMKLEILGHRQSNLLLLTLSLKQ